MRLQTYGTTVDRQHIAYLMVSPTRVKPRIHLFFSNDPSVVSDAEVISVPYNHLCGPRLNEGGLYLNIVRVLRRQV